MPDRWDSFLRSILECLFEAASAAGLSATLLALPEPGWFQPKQRLPEIGLSCGMIQFLTCLKCLFNDQIGIRLMLTKITLRYDDNVLGKAENSGKRNLHDRRQKNVYQFVSVSLSQSRSLKV